MITRRNDALEVLGKMGFKEKLSADRQLAFVEVLRAMACLLVVYCHLVGGPAERLKVQWPPHEIVTTLIIRPFQIPQNFGFFGVLVFFLISGFIITFTGSRESRKTFFIKRLLRIHPPLIFSCTLVLIMAATIKATLGWDDPILQIPSFDVAMSMLGIDIFIAPLAVLGVGWTISIELVFYFFMLLLLNHLRTKPVAACLIIMLLSTAIAWGCSLLHELGDKPFGILKSVILHFPVFAIGMDIFYVWSNIFSFRFGVLLGLLGIAVYIFNYTIFNAPLLDTPYNQAIQVVYAIGFFILVMRILENAKRSPRIIRFFSDISYSLYLVHAPVGFFSFTYLAIVRQWNFTTSVLLSILASIFVAAVSFYFVEQPAKRLARRLVVHSRYTPGNRAALVDRRPNGLSEITQIDPN